MAKLSKQDRKAIQVNSMAQSKGWSKLQAGLEQRIENLTNNLIRAKDEATIRKLQGRISELNKLITDVEHYQRKANKINQK